MGGLRFEAWTLPWSASFDRVVADIPVVTGSGLRKFGAFGSASINVPADYDRITDIVSPTVGSLIRCYDGVTIVHEFLAERVDHRLADNGLATIAGDDLASAFQRAVIYPFDYPDQPTTFPNHVWAGRNLLTNPGFESFGVTPETWELFNDQTGGGQFTLSDGVDTTSLINFDAGASTVEARIEDDLGLVNDCLVTGTGEFDPGVTEDPWVIEIADEPVPFVGLALTVADTGLTSTLTKVQVGFLTPTGWTKSQTTSRGTSQRVFGTYDNFELVTGTVDTGTYALLVNPGAIPEHDFAQPNYERFAGVQQVIRVQPGGTYQASIRVNPVSGTDSYRFVIRSVDGDFIASDTGGLGSSTHTAATWSTVSIVNVVIPDNVTQIVYRFSNTNDTGNPSGFRLDTATFLEGEAAATVGTIVTSLMDDASTDHSGDTRGTILDWVDYTGFDGTNDSTTTAWDDSSLSFTAHRGKPYANVFDDLTGLGYEWTLTPKATPAAGLTHDLDWFNKDAAGTDHTTAATPAINAGQSTLSGPVVQRIPRYTAILVEGEGGAYTEDKDGTAETNFGRLELYEGDTTLGDTATRTALSDELLSLEATNRTAVEVVIVRNDDHPIPLVDYLPGDNILFQIPPTLAKTARRIQQIAWRTGEPSVYTVTGSRVFGGEAAAWEGLNRLLNKFTPLEVPEGRGDDVNLGGAEPGGTFTITVAASDALTTSIDRADRVCGGVNDQITIQNALNDLPTAGGRILLSEGTFKVNFNGTANVINSPSTARTTLQGMGRGTIISVQDSFAGVEDSVDVTAIVFDDDFCTIRNLSIIGGDGVSAATLGAHVSDYGIIHNVYIATDGAGINLQSSQYAIITNNVLESTRSGILLAETDDSIIRGNVINFVGRHGIQVAGVTGSDRNVITGNTIINPSQTTDDTYDGIFVETSDNNLIADNQITGTSGTPAPRYGINISNSSCDNNRIGDNHFGPAADYATFVLNDAGTGTKYPTARTADMSQGGTLVIGVGVARYPIAEDSIIIDAHATVGTAPSGGPVTLDINKNGTTMYATATNPSIAVGTNVGNKAPADQTSFVANDYITLDLDAVNSAADLTCVVRFLVI